MSTKQNPGTFDCYASLEPDEPYFIVRAKDAHAPLLVQLWAVMRETAIAEGLKPADDTEKVEEAKQTAYEMKRWRRTREIGRIEDRS